jgi:hypothetical protein
MKDKRLEGVERFPAGELGKAGTLREFRIAFRITAVSLDEGLASAKL